MNPAGFEAALSGGTMFSSISLCPAQAFTGGSIGEFCTLVTKWVLQMPNVTLWQGEERSLNTI